MVHVEYVGLGVDVEIANGHRWGNRGECLPVEAVHANACLCSRCEYISDAVFVRISNSECWESSRFLDWQTVRCHCRRLPYEQLFVIHGKQFILTIAIDIRNDRITVSDSDSLSCHGHIPYSMCLTVFEVIQTQFAAQFDAAIRRLHIFGCAAHDEDSGRRCGPILGESPKRAARCQGTRL